MQRSKTTRAPQTQAPGGGESCCMPELPEVETTRRGIAPWLVGQRLQEVKVWDRKLRWPVPADLPRRLRGALVEAVDRRGKYLLLGTDRGTALVHLGMTGSLRVLPEGGPRATHDRVDFITVAGVTVRFNDPRRFGSLLWGGFRPLEHPLLAELGPEPLSQAFDGAYLYACSRGRRVSIKPHIMNARVVVGVGNIYASEALFRAGIHPQRPAGRVGLERMERLSTAIKQVLNDSIRVGGTTLRDFFGGDGQPGYFRQRLQVYERAGEPCRSCGGEIHQRVLGQRSSYFCVRCQR